MLNKKCRTSLMVLALVLLIFLSGCVNLAQEIVIREDGSGVVRFTLGVETTAYPQFQELIPEAYQMENLFKGLLSSEGVTDIRWDNYEANGYTWQSLQMEVSDIYQLFAEPQSIGLATVNMDQDGESFVFQQSLDLEGSNMRIPGLNLVDLAGAGYTIRLITPQITETNGLQEAAGTSVWEIELSELLQGGTASTLRAEYLLEPYEGVFIPWETFYSYLVIGVLALGGLSILVIIIVNTSGREKQQKLKF
jgi:hypothetical protein